MQSIQVTVDFKFDESATKSLADLLTPAIKMALGQSSDDFDPRAAMRLRASQNANFRGQKPPEDQGLLVDAKETAKLLRISPRKLWDLYNTGKMPQPIRIGRVLRWSFDGLKKWVDAGCPSIENHL